MFEKNDVRTRFAPSPTGYMHIGNLRTALYAYLIAKKNKGTFILRIEDTDRARLVEGATEIIIKTLKNAGLVYDEGPDVGGPVGPYVQSERKEIYGRHAKELCASGAAYYCFCASDEAGLETNSQNTDDPCRGLPYEESKRRADAGEPFAVRMKAPKEGETTVVDMVFGEVTTPNKILDDMVLLKRDGMPTYNFANVIDDHLMGITHVLRGSEYISSAPKYNLLYEAFGWEIPEYITVSMINRDAHNKLSKRHGDPTYNDLLEQGYLPEAVLNFVALLGWSPGGEREIFTLDELVQIFDVSGISKSPAVFDIEKLKHFNGEYIRKMPPEEFAKLAGPYIRKAVKNEHISVGAIAALLQPRLEKLSDIPGKIGFFDTLREYDTALFEHQKSKVDKTIALEMLKAAKNEFETLTASGLREARADGLQVEAGGGQTRAGGSQREILWTNEAIYGILTSLAEKLGVKNAALMWPVRIAVSGVAVTPGGAVEICHILGREETLRRIEIGIKALQADQKAQET
ncbi:MAG: glutamate--tRNA ligase [Oscillospiraceae bacterium]|nr:glutamate--tRNA ligase [Oscillospiraceae bacterium]